jgi:hypothetical protein
VRNVEFSALIQQARQWVDIGASQDPPDADIANFGNQSFTQFFEKVADATDSDYFWEYYSFITQQGVNDYTIPVDLDRLRRVDNLISGNNGSNQQWATVRRYDEAKQNAYGAYFGGQTMPGNQTIRLGYCPTAPVLSQYAFLTVLAQPNTDPVDGLTFTAQQPGNFGANISITIVNGASISWAIGATPLAITLTVVSGVSTCSAIVTSLAIAPVQVQALISVATAFPSSSGVAFSNPISATNLGGTLQFNFINGFDRYLVADMASMICRRLERDPTNFEAEKLRLEPLLTARAARRDSNDPQVAKDVMGDRLAMAGPFFAVYPNRFVYRIYGQQMKLLPFVA